MSEGGFPAPAVELPPFTIERPGKRLGFEYLRVRVGGHVLEVFATDTHEGREQGRRVHAVLDGRRLVRGRQRKPYFIFSGDVIVQRWILASAAEFDGARPVYTYLQIARNLNRARSSRRRYVNLSMWSVRRVVLKLAPELAKRRAEWWRRGRWEEARRQKERRKVPSAAQRRRNAETRAAIVKEVRGAGLL